MIFLGVQECNYIPPWATTGTELSVTNKYYKLEESAKKSSGDAETSCIAQGGNLITVKSQEDAIEFAALIRKSIS